MAETPKVWVWVWVCNECGSREYSSAIPPSDIAAGRYACSGCGSDEFHLEEVARV